MNTPAPNIGERVRRMAPVAAPSEQQEETAAVSRLLERASREREATCRLVGPGGEELVIPGTIVRVFEDERKSGHEMSKLVLTSRPTAS